MSLQLSQPTIDKVVVFDFGLEDPFSNHDWLKDLEEKTIAKGGAGSGNWRHTGRPGQRGGSASVRAGPASVLAGSAPIGPDRTTGVMDYFFMAATQVDEDDGEPMPWQLLSEEERADVKDELVTELSGRTGIDYDTVNSVVGGWAQTSNDADAPALQIQESATEVFGVKMSSWQQGKIDELKRSNPDAWDEAERKVTSEQRESILREMYKTTQERLDNEGFGPDATIRLRRGIILESGEWKVGDTIGFDGSALESWSVGPKTAARFTTHNDYTGNQVGLVLEMDVPVKSIVSTARTGFGCIAEGEVVVLGSVSGQTARIIGKTRGTGKPWVQHFETSRSYDWDVSDGEIRKIGTYFSEAEYVD